MRNYEDIVLKEEQDNRMKIITLMLLLMFMLTSCGHTPKNIDAGFCVVDVKTKEKWEIISSYEGNAVLERFGDKYLMTTDFDHNWDLINTPCPRKKK